jgi:hypothetical protein
LKSLFVISEALYHEGIWGNGSIETPFLTSALYGGESSASRPGRFIPGESTLSQYPLNRRLGETQSRSGCYGEEKNLAMPGIKHRPSSLQLITLLTELSRLPHSMGGV